MRVNAQITLSIIVCVIGGCGSTQPRSGEWIPMSDGDDSKSPKVLLGQKYGVPGKDHLYDGLVVWREVSLIDVPTIAFAWSGDSVTYWFQRQNHFDLEKHKVAVVSCEGLGNALPDLLLKIGDSVKKMTDPTLYTDAVVLHSPVYDAKYMSDIGGVVRVTSFQHDPVSWTSAADTVMEIGKQCVQAQRRVR